MPTNAFKKLSKTKKQKLMSDGIEVFSKLKYKQTNVNEITKALGITRTAFYYYFTDKKDFYEYLLYGKIYGHCAGNEKNIPQTLYRFRIVRIRCGGVPCVT